MSVLKIDSSARIHDSHSRILTQYLVERISEKESKNGVTKVVERDLVKQPLPNISGEDLLDLAASSQDPRESLQQHTQRSNDLIGELMEAKHLVFGVAMYNFSIPATLKQWVDYVCRAGLTFKYSEQGPEGSLLVVYPWAVKRILPVVIWSKFAVSLALKKSFILTQVDP